MRSRLIWMSCVPVTASVNATSQVKDKVALLRSNLRAPAFAEVSDSAGGTASVDRRVSAI
jgi:hypothetical protein